MNDAHDAHARRVPAEVRMADFHNIHACLVHERPECVVDLVRNLRALDPTSTVLVYDGGPQPGLLRGLGLEAMGARLHPRPRPMRWGALHDFALDCMRWAIAAGPFDALTIVDSDQLCLRAGYSERLAAELRAHPRTGLLGCDPRPQPRFGATPPAVAAWKELELWRPFLERFGCVGEFPRWTFWPSTAFSADAARALVALFDGDRQLADILRRSRLWATEEVLFPTLTALLGFEVRRSFSTYDVVKYRVPYSQAQVSGALGRPDAFWIHPVPRALEHPVRRQIRDAHRDYRPQEVIPMCTDELLLTLPLIEQMKSIEGWLEPDEADLLLAAARRSQQRAAGPLVEVGSYCGRSTVLLGAAAREAGAGARAYAIDPHEGVVGAADRRIERTRPTLEKFRDNVRRAGVDDWIELLQKYSHEVAWSEPIALLFIDGLHDYDNVSRDFSHFSPHVRAGGYVAFHDYAPYYPGVVRCVDEVLAGGGWRRVSLVRSMIVLQRLESPSDTRTVEPERAANVVPDAPEIAAARDPASGERTAVGDPDAPRITAAPTRPLVSCIMPTKDRRAFIPQSIGYFLEQATDAHELIIVDDGTDAVADLIPEDPRIRYRRLERRATIGAKRNMACAEARGDVIVHWDDDDWSAPWRLAYQVGALEVSGADVVGLSHVLYEDVASGQAWRYVYPSSSKAWVAGCTLCYRRTLWQQTPFADIDVGEDTRFVWGRRETRIKALEDERFFVARIHPRNSCAKNTRDRRWARVDAAVIAAAKAHRPEQT